MLGRGMITLCSEIHTKYVKTICLHKEEFLNVSLEVLKVFENRVLRKIFGPKRDEVTGE
jgi:hypothetical protein